MSSDTQQVNTALVLYLSCTTKKITLTDSAENLYAEGLLKASKKRRSQFCIYKKDTPE